MEAITIGIKPMSLTPTNQVQTEFCRDFKKCAYHAHFFSGFSKARNGFARYYYQCLLNPDLHGHTPKCLYQEEYQTWSLLQK